MRELLSISREENKRYYADGTVFNFSEAGRFANLFSVLVEFFLDGKVGKRFEKKFGGKVDDLPNRLVRLKAFFESLDTDPVESELALIELEWQAFSEAEANHLLVKYQKLSAEQVAKLVA